MSQAYDSQEPSRILALSSIAIALSETLNLDELLYKAVNKCVEILKYDAAALYLLGKEKNTFIAEYLYGFPEHVEQSIKVFPIFGLTARVVKTGESIVVPNVEPYHEQRPYLSAFKSIIIVPVKVRKETVGVFLLHSKATRQFKKDEIMLIESIGLQIGVASENARMFESMQKMTGQLHELVEFNRKLSTCMNLQEIGELLVHELDSLIGAQTILLNLNNGDQPIIHSAKPLDVDRTAARSLITLFKYPPNLVHHYSDEAGSTDEEPFFRSWGKGTAMFVHFQFTGISHCLIVGRSTNDSWSETEQNLFEAVSKIVDLALYKAHLFQELDKSRQLNAQLLAAQIAAQEKERERIASDIHDSINQSMVGIHFHLQYCLEELQSAPEQVRPILEKLLQMTEKSMTEFRLIIHDLHPVAIQKFGFLGAVEELVSSYSTQKALRVDMIVTGEPVRFRQEVEISLYRIFQESINNIVKHAKASRAEFAIHFGKDDLTIVIRDFGQGFDSDSQASQGTTYGLIGMRRRVEQLKGSFNIDENAAPGTRIDIKLDISGLRIHQEV
ncbi:GAF domain-containing sensor histidine kinase [Cohnella abietis]|uniref:histidine kinase n=1 Tax=Cohnella abietis TaxID=2507935 RepID=A0A3T1DCU9_9BACL|nr:GAF domain-containing sensor histidine kinase [Cohnella abietis]BBI35976.1 hypothetical protein KCTCHS21_53750 [Cohnella abietis]